MEPKVGPSTTPGRTDGFTPKWRQFHPLSRVTVQNPFDHDVVFQVANEYNQPYQYRIQANKVAELPGGAIATLGVKAIVDELIQNNKQDAMHMWDPLIRAKHEKDVILLFKETKPKLNPDRPGEIDLTNSTEQGAMEAPAPADEPEVAFPGLNEDATPEPALDPLPAAAKSGLDEVIGASLPAQDSIVGPNNAHTDAEG